MSQEKIIVTRAEYDARRTLLCSLIAQGVFVDSDHDGTGIRAGCFQDSDIKGFADAADLVLRNAFDWKVGQRKDDKLIGALAQ